MIAYIKLALLAILLPQTLGLVQVKTVRGSAAVKEEKVKTNKEQNAVSLKWLLLFVIVSPKKHSLILKSLYIFETISQTKLRNLKRSKSSKSSDKDETLKAKIYNEHKDDYDDLEGWIYITFDDDEFEISYNLQ